MKRLKVKWSIDKHETSPDLLEKIPVDAGNLDEVISDNFMFWDPPIGVQIDRLTQEWSNPNSDGTGVLTFHTLSTELTNQMAKEMKEDIDNEILKAISNFAG